MLHRGVLTVNERAHLLLGCGNHARVAMPGADNADARREIEVSAALNIVNGATKRMIDGDGSGLFEMR